MTGACARRVRIQDARAALSEARRVYSEIVARELAGCAHDDERVREAFPRDPWGDGARSYRVCLDCGLAEWGEAPHVLLAPSRYDVETIADEEARTVRILIVDPYEARDALRDGRLEEFLRGRVR